MKPIRHGDVNLYPITKEEFEKLTNGLKEIKTNGQFVLAEGETTGHKHVLVTEKPKLKVFKLADGRGVLFAGAPFIIKHEEHKILSKPGGYYIQVPERELDHFQESIERKVID